MRRIFEGDLEISTPFTYAFPEVGASSVASMRMVVLFPAPLGPTKPCSSPAPISRLNAGDCSKTACVLSSPSAEQTRMGTSQASLTSFNNDAPAVASGLSSIISILPANRSAYATRTSSSPARTSA